MSIYGEDLNLSSTDFNEGFEQKRQMAIARAMEIRKRQTDQNRVPQNDGSYGVTGGSSSSSKSQSHISAHQRPNRAAAPFQSDPYDEDPSYRALEAYRRGEIESTTDAFKLLSTGGKRIDTSRSKPPRDSNFAQLQQNSDVAKARSRLSLLKSKINRADQQGLSQSTDRGIVATSSYKAIPVQGYTDDNYRISSSAGINLTPAEGLGKVTKPREEWDNNVDISPDIKARPLPNRTRTVRRNSASSNEHAERAMGKLSVSDGRESSTRPVQKPVIKREWDDNTEVNWSDPKHIPPEDTVQKRTTASHKQSIPSRVRQPPQWNDTSEVHPSGPAARVTAPVRSRDQYDEAANAGQASAMGQPRQPVGRRRNVSKQPTPSSQNTSHEPLSSHTADSHDNTGVAGRKGGYPNLDDLDDGIPPPEYSEQRECPDCGRRFNAGPFEKHIKICQKVFQQKRKVFDSKQMRIVDDEHAQLLQKNEYLEKRERKLISKRKKSTEAPVGKSKSTPKWKEDSSKFREAMRAASEVTKAIKSGAPLPPPKVSAPDESLMQCPNCLRRFNHRAGERHIPQCKNIKAQPKSLKRGTGVQASNRSTGAPHSRPGVKF
jgi:hypothetical protein